MLMDYDVRDNTRWTFSLEEALLWIMDSYFSQKQWFKVKNILMMELFLTNTQTRSFCLLKTLTDGLEWCVNYLWIIVMFLSAVWTLILTAPIHCRASIAEQEM